MRRLLSKYTEKLYLKHWVIGLCRRDIKDIIKEKEFNYEIEWLKLGPIDHYIADPFLLRASDGSVNLLVEDFSLANFYGTIALVSLDKNLNKIHQRTLLDTETHLSYPFVFYENGKVYVFPESSHSGRLDCYEYDNVNNILKFVKEVINLPLLDSTIIKYDDKYWLFGTLNGEDSNSKLYIYISDNLLGPYKAHPKNPVKNQINGSRPAGNFIEVEGCLYRPAQNCENEYGESITINKVISLNEIEFAEEPYMIISPDLKNMYHDRIFTMHTINAVDDLIVVDGMRWTFSPRNQLRFFLKNMSYARQLKEACSDK